MAALLRSTRYWEESWRLAEIFCHSNCSEKSSVKVGIKNSKRNKIIHVFFNMKVYIFNPGHMLQNKYTKSTQMLLIIT